MSLIIRGAERMKKRIFSFSLLTLVFLCGAFPAFAQDSAAAPRGAAAPVRLSPDSAVELAVNSNLNLETARIALDIKRRKSDLVWNEFLPTVSAVGTLSRDNWASTSQGVDFTALPNVVPYSIELPQWHATGALSAELTFSFALIQGIRSYKQDYQAGLITLEKARLQIEQGVRKMYNQILLLEASAALLTDSYNNAQRQAETAEANYRAGLAPRLNWLQAQVAVENMKPQINDMDNNLKSLKGNFALLLGLPYDVEFELEPITLAASYIPSDVAELIARAAAEKPDIRELQANIITLRSQRSALALQLYTPFIRFGWTLSSMFNPRLNPLEESWFTSDNWSGGGNFSVTLGWSLNSLFPFTKEGQQLRDMDANMQIQNIRLAQMVQETELEIFTKINSLERIRTTAEAQQAAVELAELSYRLTEDAYRAGLQDFQSVQAAALALEQARLQLMTQQFNYLNDLIDLEYSLGVPFGTISSDGNSNSGSM